jgi:hypothetical protein
MQEAGAALPIVSRLRNLTATLVRNDDAAVTWREADAIERMKALIEKQLRQKASAAWDSEARAILAKLEGDV